MALVSWCHSSQLLYVCSSLLIENTGMSISFISYKWETAMTSQVHVTTASLKQANKTYIERNFYRSASQKVPRIRYCFSHSELSDSTKYNVKVLSWADELRQWSYKQKHWCRITAGLKLVALCLWIPHCNKMQDGKSSKLTSKWVISENKKIKTL